MTERFTLGRPRTIEILELFYRERYSYYARTNRHITDHKELSLLVLKDVEGLNFNPYAKGPLPPSLHLHGKFLFTKQIKDALKPKKRRIATIW